MSLDIYDGTFDINYRVGFECSKCKEKRWIETARLYELIKEISTMMCKCNGFDENIDYIEPTDLIKIKRTGEEIILIKNGLRLVENNSFGNEEEF